MVDERDAAQGAEIAQAEHLRDEPLSEWNDTQPQKTHDRREHQRGGRRYRQDEVDWFDPILQRFARSFPKVRLRYRSRLEVIDERPDCVIASLRDLETGAAEQIAAEYLVGCDGAGSTVRGACGIGLTGQGLLGHAVNMFFRAPGLLDACRKAPGTFFILVDGGGVWGNIRIIDPTNALWRLMVNETGPGTTLESVDKSAYLRRGIGREFPVEWVDLNIWRRQSMLAESYGGARVFLAGDAVHQVSPTGALGMNTGLADAVDLGWKLAATLAGWGGPGLLASYDAERRPVGRRAVLRVRPGTL